MDTSCFNPTALVTNLQVDNTTVNFSWTAPRFLTAGFVNYMWEVRSSGLPGSGAAGLFASGSTALTNDSVTGLLPGIPYTFYVKSSCHAWTRNINGVLTPLCSTPVFPYVENFEGVVGTSHTQLHYCCCYDRCNMRTRDAACRHPFSSRNSG
ncbi:MAG: hypothetical protein IPP30_10695 [Flavobacterium sp.]|nr:hypothetical protein [Flavobacterium sp.]